MIDINTALQNILKAIYGKDVRQSIHDAIYQINQNANEAVDLAQIKFGTDVTSPTSSVGTYTEGTVYFNVQTGIIWRLNGGSWSELGSMKSIDSIAKTSTVGLTDTYTITYNDGTTATYNVTNGEKGTSITSVVKGTTTGLVDHYDINLSDGTKEGFDVTNGKDGVNGLSISDISLASTVGNVKTYDVNLSDGTKTPTGFSVTDGTSNYVHIRYSANFDGSGMVSIPTATTVYIGIVVTTQSTAPTDPSVYSWVKFIGDSGSGTGDMLKADYATKYAGVVDKAAALYDGANEILANELLDKTSYCTKGVAGTVDKATQLVDVTNAKTADTVLLANLTDDGTTGLKYKGAEIGGKVDIDESTIVENASGKLEVPIDSADFVVDSTSKKVQLSTSVKTKLSNIGDEWNNATAYTKGMYAIDENVLYRCLADNTNKKPSENATLWSATKVGNELKDLAPIDISANIHAMFSSDYTPNFSNVGKSGGVVEFSFNIVKSTALTYNVWADTGVVLPSGYRPSKNHQFRVTSLSNPNYLILGCIWKADGKLQLKLFTDATMSANSTLIADTGYIGF